MDKNWTRRETLRHEDEGIGLPDNPATIIEGAFDGRRLLCIHRIGTATFADAFGRSGIKLSDFERLFDERLLEGKQSNLTSDLRVWVKSYPCVLYAWEGLRHVTGELRKRPNLICARNPVQVVVKFFEHIEPRLTKSPQEVVEPSRTRRAAVKRIKTSIREMGCEKPKFVLPNHPPRGERGELQIGLHHDQPIPNLSLDLLSSEFDLDSLFEGLKEQDSYRELTIAGRTQVLMKILREHRYFVSVLPSVRVTDVTDVEHHQLEIEIPKSFYEPSRQSIMPLVAIRKGLPSFGLPAVNLVVDADRIEIIACVAVGDSEPVTTCRYGNFVYFVSWDGSVDFPKDEQWFSHPAVRAVIREWKTRDKGLELLEY